ncbi:MAG: hypothetical protein NWR42_03880 [Desulfobacterales bacterium]|jgi:hypothetical protein|nr:hypothetical protein [Desulfobacterales bacterium]
MELFRNVGINCAQGVNKDLNLLILQKNAQLCSISGGRFAGGRVEIETASRLNH